MTFMYVSFTAPSEAQESKVYACITPDASSYGGRSPENMQYNYATELLRRLVSSRTRSGVRFPGIASLTLISSLDTSLIDGYPAHVVSSMCVLEQRGALVLPSLNE
jgi:hypothetical protein